MKKIAFLAFVLSGMVTLGFAQEFYFRAGLGYAFPATAQSTYDTPIPYYEYQSAYNGTRTINANGTQTYNIKTASLSAGVQSVIGLGYMFTENIGVQLDAGIGISNTTYTFNDNNIPLNVGGSTPVPYNISTTQHANSPVFMMPSLVLQTSGDKIKAYSRFGFALPLNTKVTQDQVFTNGAGTGALTVDDFTWQIKSGFSLGYTAAAGIKYKISDKVSLWAELSLLSVSVYTKEQDLKSWVEDGQSVPLSNYTTAQTIKFSKTATIDSTYSQFPAYAQPFSNMGINVGINITISKHERAAKDDGDYIDKSKPFRRNN